MLGLLTGLLTGLPLAQAMTGKLDADIGSLVAAHLNALLGMAWIVACAWSLPLLKYGATGLARIGWTLVVCNYSNWLVTFIKAFLHVKGVGFGGNPANDAVFGVLGVTVVVPALVAGGAWVGGWGEEGVTVAHVGGGCIGALRAGCCTLPSKASRGMGSA
jgi:hydroxylaminobenzene mutase